MSDQDIRPDKYSELRSKYKYYIDSFNALYHLKAENDEDLNKIYNMIKTELLDSKKYLPSNIVRDILNIIPLNNRYAKAYLSLAKQISDDYHVKETNNVEDVSDYLFYKEYGIRFKKYIRFEKIITEKLDFLTEDTIYRAIKNNDLEKFISFTEREGFDKDQELCSRLYPALSGCSLLELCCYYGSVDCFKFLRTKFNSEITEGCLELSFLGRSKEIMSECLKYQKPNLWCMRYAIISHNIDFVTFLMNEYNLEIDLEYCGKYNNLESILIYVDQNIRIREVFKYSAMLDIPSFCEYLLSHFANINENDTIEAINKAASYNNVETAKNLILHGANINKVDGLGNTVLYVAVWNYSKEIVELLITHGANINKNKFNGQTPLHDAAEYNSKEIAELLILHGANVNEKDDYDNTALHNAAWNNSKEITELLISHGANINEKDNNMRTALHLAAENNSKETAELLISHGANLNKINIHGQTALHIATGISQKTSELLFLKSMNTNERCEDGITDLINTAFHDSKEIAKLLISHGANINEIDYFGRTALHYSAIQNNKDIVELLISHGANINEKNKDGKTALHLAAENNCKEVAELLISHGANINEKDNDRKTPLHLAVDHNYTEVAELLISHGATNSVHT